MKSMNLTYSHKELQWLFFSAVVAGLNASLRKRGYFITFKVSEDSFYYEFWKAASVAEKGDGEMIASHQVNKGEYQMNDIRLGIMIKYMEDEANKFMVAISQLTLKDYDSNGSLDGTESKMATSEGSLLFTTWHTSKHFPAQDPTEEDLSEYILIDPDGNRTDFCVGYYHFGVPGWMSKEAGKEIDVKHMKWTELPLNREQSTKSLSA